jgi:TPR repeat protein
MLASTNSPTSVPPSGAMASASVALSSVATRAAPEQPRQAEERTDPREQPVPSAVAANIQPPAHRPTSPAEQAPPAPTRKATTAEQRSAPDFVVSRQLDRDELVSMLRRAEDFIKSGDLSSARILLRRAAEAGDAQAALTLGGTFDPSVLAALGLQDGAADIAMARLWYERAEQFGSSEAPRRLRELATSSVK